MKIYVPHIVKQVQVYYASHLHYTQQPVIRTHLTTLAELLFDGINKGEEYLYSEINNYHPLHLGSPFSELKNANLDLHDCQWTIASEFGYKSWDDVLDLKETKYIPEFESAVDCVINGDLLGLKHLVENNKDIIHMRSQYGHKATLLHYAASNGVEMWRQQVPYNLPNIVEFLLESGSDKYALIPVYGSQFDTLSLLKTSAHPYEAGVGKEIEMLLS